MKKISLLFFALFGFATFGMAQEPPYDVEYDIEMFFYGQDDYFNRVRIDSIAAYNTHYHWRETLYYPDTTVRFTLSSGLAEAEAGSPSLRCFPNPCSGKATAVFTLAHAEPVAMQVFDLQGRLVAACAEPLGAGTHQFDIQLAQPQAYLLAVQTATQRTALKMVNLERTSANQISYIGENKDFTSFTKNLKGDIHRPGSLTDTVIFVSYASRCGEVFTDTLVQKGFNTYSWRHKAAFPGWMLEMPRIERPTASNITTNSVTLSTSYDAVSCYEPVSAGFCVDTLERPTVEGGSALHRVVEGDSETLTQALSGLVPGEAYYVRAFTRSNDNTITYSDQSAFSTTTSDGFTCGVSTLTDVCGNEYATIQMGRDCWMKENLRATRYADNVELVSAAQSGSDHNPFFAYPDNDSSLVADYGCLYNWQAAVRVPANQTQAVEEPCQGICPDGWHVPTTAEFEMLISYANGNRDFLCEGQADHIAAALADTMGWDDSAGACSPGAAANNASGFSARPSGIYNMGSTAFGMSAEFWTSRLITSGPFGGNWAMHYGTSNTSAQFSSNSGPRYSGRSVRCVKD